MSAMRVIRAMRAMRATEVTGQKEEKKEKEKMKFLRTDRHTDQSNVVQEVLADLKIRKISGRLMSDAAPRSPSSPTRPEGQGGCAHHTATTTTLCPIYDLSGRSILY